MSTPTLVVSFADQFRRRQNQDRLEMSGAGRVLPMTLSGLQQLRVVADQARDGLAQKGIELRQQEAGLPASARQVLGGISGHARAFVQEAARDFSERCAAFEQANQQSGYAPAN